MKTLWAPWRMTYLEEPPPTGCFFCAAFASDDDRAHLVLARDAESIALLNKYPYVSGHLLVAPRAHVPRPEDLPEAAYAALAAIVRRGPRARPAELTPERLSPWMNVCRAP